MLRPTRSDFIPKLHDVLENPPYPNELRWTYDGAAFLICTDNKLAVRALSPKWNFRS